MFNRTRAFASFSASADHSDQLGGSKCSLHKTDNSRHLKQQSKPKDSTMFIICLCLFSHTSICAALSRHSLMSSLYHRTRSRCEIDVKTLKVDQVLLPSPPSSHLHTRKPVTTERIGCSTCMLMVSGHCQGVKHKHVNFRRVC